MKRFAVTALLLVLATSALAEGTQRYIVGVRPSKGGPLSKLEVSVDVSSRPVMELENIGAYVVDLTPTEAVRLRRDSAVRYVEPEILYHALEVAAPNRAMPAQTQAAAAQTTPWGIAQVHAPEVWPVAAGDEVNVAVVDTGIDRANADLGAAYAGGYNVFSVPPFNVPSEPSDPTDDDGHGSHVSGTIGARDNGVGVVGVAPRARIWAVRVMKHQASGSATGSTSGIAAGLNWILGKKQALGGRWIVNMSLGGDYSQAIASACTKLSDAGVLVFAASGNESTSTTPAAVGYPAALPTVIAVGATDVVNKIAEFSNQGPEVAIVAPGVGILSTWLVGQGADTHVLNGSSSYEATPLGLSPRGSVTGQYVYCGLGKTAADFPASVNGNIALIKRGDVQFSLKVRNAVAAGAVGAVIFNNVDGLFNGTLDGGNPGDTTFGWPVTIGIGKASGETLAAAQTNPTMTLTYQSGDTMYEQGTSMSTPHAAGVAALIWSVAPDASPTSVRAAMMNTALDLGTPGRDVVFGYGLVNALEAAKSLAPSKFDSGQQPPTVQNPSVRRVLKRK